MSGASANPAHSNDAEAAPQGARLRVVRPRDPRVALGMAVNYLMTDPVFARLPFGQWSRVLVGQVNRSHHLFAVEGGRVVGFVGWALTTRDRAEAWVSRSRDISSADSASGEMVLINAWKADTPAVNRFLVRAFRHVIREKEMVYARRFYGDGRVRPVRLPVGARVAQHILKQTSPLESQGHSVKKVVNGPQ